jgi:hypothetical protein
MEEFQMQNNSTVLATVVGGVNLVPLEYSGQRVVMSEQLAELYATTSKIISFNFNNNKSKYIAGLHYHLLIGDEMRAFRDEHGLPKNTRTVYLWTESGALLHAKSIKNDRAWGVYIELMNAYFRLRDSNAVVTREQVYSDLSNFIGMAVSKINELTREKSRLQLMSAIDSEQQRQLREIVKHKILDLVGGDSARYNEIFLAANSEVWAIYRRKFHLDSYHNTPQYLFDEAVAFLENWQPSAKFTWRNDLCRKCSE